MKTLVIGIGNAWRRDDAAGLSVAHALAGTLPGVEVIEHEGDPSRLIEAWEGAEAVWLVDAMVSGSTPGTVRRIDATEQELPAELFRASTHLVGLGEAVELARTLGRLPARVVFYGIEGGSFEAGEGLTPEVESAIVQVVEAVRSEIEPGAS